VPINTIKRILPMLLKEGRVVRADLGVTRVLELDEGLLIVELAEDGPAARAKLRPVQVRYVRSGPYVRAQIDPERADILVAVAGTRVKSVGQLLTEVESHEPGTRVAITVLRQGQLVDVPVVLGRSE
jgi:S1-C subfamily serine protease